MSSIGIHQLNLFPLLVLKVNFAYLVYPACKDHPVFFPNYFENNGIDLKVVDPTL